MILRFQDYGLQEYSTFLAAKRIPEFEVLTAPPREDSDWPPALPISCGIAFNDRFAHFVDKPVPAAVNAWQPIPCFLFDDQAAIVRMALDAERFAIWKDCGLGKTLEALEWARQVAILTCGRVLIVTLNEIIAQFVEEWLKFYGDNWATPGNVELCAGCRVEVTDQTCGDTVLCILRDGREVWIEGRYL